MNGWEYLLFVVVTIVIIRIVVYFVRIYGDIREREAIEFEQIKRKEAEQRGQVKQGRLKTMGRCPSCKYSDCVKDCYKCANKITNVGFPLCRCVKYNFDQNKDCPYYEPKEKQVEWDDDLDS